jgi:hypothetical protein
VDRRRAAQGDASATPTGKGEFAIELEPGKYKLRGYFNGEPVGAELEVVVAPGRPSSRSGRPLVVTVASPRRPPAEEGEGSHARLSRFWYGILALSSASTAFILFLTQVYNHAGNRAMSEALSADSSAVDWFLRDDARKRSSALDPVHSRSAPRSRAA